MINEGQLSIVKIKDKRSDSERSRKNESLNGWQAKNSVCSGEPGYLWTLLQVGDDPLLQPPARMSYVPDFRRAIEGTRLLRYSPLLNSLVELIPLAIQGSCQPTVRRRR